MTHEMPIKDVIKTLKEIKDGQVLFYKKEALEIAIELLSTNKSEWILCEDRLPDKLVICSDIYNEVMVGYVYEDEDSKTGYTTEYIDGFMYDVVAWQPLPEPYKKGEK